MGRSNKINKARQWLIDFNRILSTASDDEKSLILGDGLLDNFLNSFINKKMLDPKSNIYEKLLSYKNTFELAALMRFVITANCSFKGKVNNKECFVSPLHYQWFEDGVMFTQGENPFEGVIGLYQNGQVKFGIAARDAQKGEMLGPEDFMFVDATQAIANYSEILSRSAESLELPLIKLNKMLNENLNDESAYQHFFEEFYWSFGLQYSKIEPKNKFDDQNIPDFTGIRCHDNCRDIIEIKTPFAQLFNAGGEFSSYFNNAWNQCERYLTFAREHAPYLDTEKNMRFNNPKCYLIAGYNLTKTEVKSISDKSKLNPAITFYSYNDILSLISNILVFIKKNQLPPKQ